MRKKPGFLSGGSFRPQILVSASGKRGSRAPKIGARSEEDWQQHRVSGCGESLEIEMRSGLAMGLVARQWHSLGIDSVQTSVTLCSLLHNPFA